MKIPKIQLDNPNIYDLLYTLNNIGAFEIVGDSIKKLEIITDKSLRDAKRLLNLPIEKLRKFNMNDYHGFHDVLKISEDKNKISSKNEIVNQIAFHIKKGQKEFVLNDFSFENLYLYFNESLTILNTLYSIIAENFIGTSKTSNLDKDSQSILTFRRYFKNGFEDVNTVGIPSHCDYGLLTLITSDVNGLEVKVDTEYEKCDFLPNYRYYVIVGDWLKFQLGDNFKSGEHRVPNIHTERHSLSVFLNPPVGEKLNSDSSSKDVKLKKKLNSKLKALLY